jgi:hypothetical protein
MSAIGHSLRLARIDVERMLRKHTNWRRSGSVVISVLIYVVLMLGSTLGGGYLGYRAGESLAGSGGLLELGPFTAIEVVRGILALFWLMLVLVYTIRAVGQRGTLPQPEGILTVVPTNQALVGVLVAEYVYCLLWLLAPSVGLGVGLALGTGVVWPALAVPLAVAAAGMGSVAVSYPLGLAIRHFATRFEFVARNKGAIIVLVFVAYFVALSTGAWNELMVQLLEPMQRSPIGWYADLLLLGTPALAASTLHASGAIALSLGLAALAIVGGTRLADRHWFSDPALAGAEKPATTAEDAAPGIERRLEPVLGTATASLVTLSWRRARRSPLKLLYAFYPLLLLAGLFADIVQSGRIPAYLPYAILLFGAWAAGVIFTLNPLGDQGAALASTLLSDVDGRTFVRAIVLAGLVVAIPLGTISTAAVAYASPLEQQTVLALVIAAPLVMVVSAILSIGIGMAFPKFEATNVTRSMKTVLPSMWAFVLFSFHLFVTAGAAAIVYEPLVRDAGAGLLSWALPFRLGVSPDTLYLIAAVALVALLIAPVASYRYAVRRFDHYTLDNP